MAAWLHERIVQKRPARFRQPELFPCVPARRPRVARPALADGVTVGVTENRQRSPLGSEIRLDH